MDDYFNYLKHKEKYFNLKQKMKSKRRQFGGNVISNSTDEIFFWSRQMMEHFYIIFIALVDTDSMEGYDRKKAVAHKNSAKVLRDDWNNIMTKYFISMGVSFDEKTQLSPEDVKKVTYNETRNREIINLLTETINAKKELLGDLETGTWLGWIYPSVVKHMLSEAEYFLKKISGKPFSLRNEIEFILNHHDEELGATAHLLDPGPDQQKTIETIRLYIHEKIPRIKKMDFGVLSKLSKEDQERINKIQKDDEMALLFLAVRFSQETSELVDDLGKDMKANKIKSIIPLMLGNHIGREFKRFNNILINARK